MKKLIAIILSVLTAVGITFGLAGCGENEPEMELPEITAEDVYYSDYLISSDFIVRKESYSEFVEYFDTEFSQTNPERFFIMNLNNDECDRLQFFLWYGNEEGMGPYLMLSFGYRIEETTTKYDVFEIIFAPLKVNPEGELTLKFGEWSHPCFPGYFYNIYYGEICVGTCRFWPSTTNKITTEWFENFFKENLTFLG